MIRRVWMSCYDLVEFTQDGNSPTCLSITRLTCFTQQISFRIHGGIVQGELLGAYYSKTRILTLPRCIFPVNISTSTVTCAADDTLTVSIRRRELRNGESRAGSRISLVKRCVLLLHLSISHIYGSFCDDFRIILYLILKHDGMLMIQLDRRRSSRQ